VSVFAMIQTLTNSLYACSGIGDTSSEYINFIFQVNVKEDDLYCCLPKLLERRKLNNSILVALCSLFIFSHLLRLFSFACVRRHCIFCVLFFFISCIFFFGGIFSRIFAIPVKYLFSSQLSPT
jgi:hypothetical protein